MIEFRLLTLIWGLLCLFPLASCSIMSQTGPQKKAIEDGEQPYTIIAVNSRADLPAAGRSYGMGQIPPPIKGTSYSDKIRPRDILQFIITDLAELSPFTNIRGEHFNHGPLEVPEYGIIEVPYIGQIQTSGRSLAAVSKELNKRVKPVSSTAQVAVIRSGRISRTANVIGEVKNPGPVALNRSGLTSLDLLAASGGPTRPEHLFKYTVRRNGRDYSFDYQGFRKKAFPIEENDLLSVTTDNSNRFYVMGAINKPTTVPFPNPAPTLADALGAATGLDERRSDPSGVFIFRKGSPDQVYTFNLKDPNAVFLTQRFPIRGEDMIYVTEAPLARWSRMINQILPATQLSSMAYDIDRISR